MMLHIKTTLFSVGVNVLGETQLKHQRRVYLALLWTDRRVRGIIQSSFEHSQECTCFLSCFLPLSVSLSPPLSVFLSRSLSPFLSLSLSLFAVSFSVVRAILVLYVCRFLQEEKVVHICVLRVQSYEMDRQTDRQANASSAFCSMDVVRQRACLQGYRFYEEQSRFLAVQT